MTHIYNPYFKS